MQESPTPKQFRDGEKSTDVKAVVSPCSTNSLKNMQESMFLGANYVK